MAGKEASFARNDPRDPLGSSVETTPDFDALERAAESIRPAWDGVAESPSPPAPPQLLTPAAAAYTPAASAPTPPAPAYVAGQSPSAADSTHRMRAQLSPSAQLDELDDLTLPRKGKSWLVPGLIGAVALAGLSVVLLRSGEPAPISAPTPAVSAAPAAAPLPQVEPAPAVVPVPQAVPAAPSAAAAAPTPAAAPTAPVAEPPPAAPAVDKAANARTKRRDKRVVKPVAAKPVAAKPAAAKPVAVAKPAPIVKKPVVAPKPAEPKRKGVGFVSDNPYQ